MREGHRHRIMCNNFLLLNNKGFVHIHIKCTHKSSPPAVNSRIKMLTFTAYNNSLKSLWLHLLPNCTFENNNCVLGIGIWKLPIGQEMQLHTHTYILLTSEASYVYILCSNLMEIIVSCFARVSVRSEFIWFLPFVTIIWFWFLYSSLQLSKK